MKLKYYLRGIAIGIIFTLAVMILTGANKKQEMSDSEIIHAAKNLGMVESQSSITITGIAPTPTPEATEAPTLEPTEAPTQNPDATLAPNEESTATESVTPTEVPTATPTPEPTTTPVPTATPTPEPTETPEPTATPTPKPTATPSPTKTPETSGTTVDKEDTVTLTVVKGMYSEAIAQAAQQLGLVKDAKDFNKYLIDHKFASSIHIGSYKIKKGASYYEIAMAITSKS